MRDEIQDLQKVVELGAPTPRGDEERQVRRKVDSGLVGNPSRLVVLGFPRPRMEKTLREAVQSIIARCAPSSTQGSIQVKAYDCSKKVFLDFDSNLEASTFHGMASSVGAFPFPNPEGGPDLQLRVRRDLPPFIQEAVLLSWESAPACLQNLWG